MIAAQYEIALPTDYDMRIIHRRIAERGSALDDRAGLGLKAYLVRDVADGSTDNAYAPFYLWTDPDALAAFHWGGGGFAGIVRDFGRPAVRTWIGGRFRPGPDLPTAPGHAVLRHVPLPPGSRPDDDAVEIDRLAEEAAGLPHTHSVAWAIDPWRWEAVILRLATAEPAPGAGIVHRVGHVSGPGITALSRSS